MATLAIKIISPTPGPKTTEIILDLISHHPQGITSRELSDRLNRPISMVNFCLKYLININLVAARLNTQEQHWIYYPRHHSLN